MLTEIEVRGEALPIRQSLVREMAIAWTRLASAGTWWTGAERLAIAAEARHAKNCKLCQRRKDALSPYTVNGEHDALGALSPDAVEAIHRLLRMRDGSPRHGCGRWIWMKPNMWRLSALSPS